MVAVAFLVWLFIATLFVGLLTLRWWYINKSRRRSPRPTSDASNLSPSGPRRISPCKASIWTNALYDLPC